MEKKKLHLIYAILGVLVLIVLVVGSTYAFFIAQEEDNTGIKGGTASGANLDLKVKRISTNANDNLIPLDNDVNSLSTAAKGYNFSGNTYDATKSCIDKNGYSVCQVYEITITNNSSASVVLDGGVTYLYGEKTPNVACAVMDSNISVTSNVTCLSSTAIADSVKFEAGDVNTYYIIVYINNLHTEQYDTGDFIGTVSFQGVSGGVTADFE